MSKQPVAPPGGVEIRERKKSAALEALESSRRIKVDALRRRSEYLGVSLEDMEEFRKLHDGECGRFSLAMLTLLSETIKVTQHAP